MKFKIIDKDGKKFTIEEKFIQDADEEVEEVEEEEVEETKAKDAKNDLDLTEEELGKLKELLEMFDGIKALVAPEDEEEVEEEADEEVDTEDEEIEEEVEETGEEETKDELFEEGDEEEEDKEKTKDSKASFGSIETKKTQDSFSEAVDSAKVWQDYYDNLLKK